MILSLASASIELGNLSHSIDSSYTKLSLLRGWINFSLNKESGDSLISAFNGSLKISDLINKNNIACNVVPNSYECSCFPSDCEKSFSSSSPSQTKNYKLNLLESKLFGIKLDKNISRISGFRFNISSDGKNSCINPLIIDLFDDGNIEFKTYNVTDEECYVENSYGCFKVSDSKETTKINSDPFCEKIQVPVARGFNIGARLIGNTSSSFIMTFSAFGFEKSCTISTNYGGNVFCKIILDNDLPRNGEAEVCISALEGSENKYSIKFEDNQPCGFAQINEEIISNHDFEIFARPLKYAVPSKMSFNDGLFEDERNMSQNIFDYISRRYNKKCTLETGCIIPLRLYSGTNQNLTLSDLLVDYDIQGLNPDGSEERNFVEITSIAPLFSSDFIKYNINSANLSVPSDTKIKKLELNIGNKKIVQNITIIEISEVSDIFPRKVSALVKTKFFVILSNSSNLSYSWDFGDNSKIEITDKNFFEHTYSKLGSYELTLNLTNELGAASKKVLIEVIAPYQAINETIFNYKLRLKSIENSLFVLPDKVQSRISETLNTADLKSSVNKIEEEYKQLFETESEELVKLMNKLNGLDVPKSFGSSLEIKDSDFVQSADRLNPELIGELGAGSFDEEKKDEYYQAIDTWIKENIDIKVNSKSYSFYFDEMENPVLTHIDLRLKPKKSFSEFFMIINGDINKIKFLGDYSERQIDENNFGLTFRDLEPEKEIKIEFLYPEKIDSFNLPFYFSPEFKFLELGFKTGNCNNNNICEPGENYKNCRSDCKPVKITIILLLTLLFLAFVIYIIMQEWYKKNYEKNLFKNQNDLFNLINFISIGIDQKMSREQIFNQLKQRKWNSEQLNYAWNKFHGKRTGMFEIPIFRFFERRKLKNELEKRKI